MEFEWIHLLEIIAICSLIYWYILQKHSYWSTLGIDGPKPTFLIGNILDRALNSPVDIETEWNRKYGKVFGYYLGTDPILSVSDVGLIKQIMIRDFHLFVNRRKLNVYHEIMSEHLLLLEGDRWKTVRSIASPTFSSGKLRGMHRLMNRCVDKLQNYLDRLTATGSNVMNTKEVIFGFTIDVIASTTFATETNANDDRKQKNPFVTNAMKFFELNPIKLLCIFALPRFINDLLDVKYGPSQKVANFFIKLSKQIVKQRKLNTVKRNDLVQLLLDASVDENEVANSSYDQLAASMDQDLKAHNIGTPETTSQNVSSIRKLTVNEVIAQCIFFMAAGFETTALTITNLLFELSQNQDIQQRLHDELNRKLDKTIDRNSEDYLEMVMSKIPFLDAVVKETLRKYPPLARLERRSNVDGYKIAGIELKKDQLVEFCVFSVHHDPCYYPEPERFNPDRFMPENKHLLTPYTYLPFGIGPRNCVGMRFAYQEIKLCLTQLVLRYQFRNTHETPERLQFKKGAFLLNAIPFPLNVSRR